MTYARLMAPKVSPVKSFAGGALARIYTLDSIPWIPYWPSITGHMLCESCNATFARSPDGELGYKVTGKSTNLQPNIVILLLSAGLYNKVPSQRACLQRESEAWLVLPAKKMRLS